MDRLPSSSPPPVVVVVGGGIAGLSAASHLLRHSPPSSFRLLLLEAAPRLGGRIRTSTIASSQVELGATWIHGIHGSPIHDIALRLSASADAPTPSFFERCDGFPPRASLVAEGGLLVHDSLVDPVVEAFSAALAGVKSGAAAAISATAEGGANSVGGFVRQGLHDFLRRNHSDGGAATIEEEDEDLGCGWSRRALQEAVYHMQEDAERLNTASNSLFDLDLEAEQEYREFGGEHVTIAGGYESVVGAMARSLPEGTVQLQKKVSKIVWNRTSSYIPPVLVCCEDGSAIEAHHVVLTVSLGVLKSMTEPQLLPQESAAGTICRSVDDLRWRLSSTKPPIHHGATSHFQYSAAQGQLFDPPLPTWKLQSISMLGFGVVNKLFLELEPTATPEIRALSRSSVELIHRRNNSVVPPWMRKTFSICPIYQGSNVLLCWFAGEQAMEMEGLTEEEIMEGVEATLRSFGLLPESGGRQRVFRRILRSKWASDPLCKGSYTFVAAGASGKDIEALAKPLPAIATSLQQDVCRPKEGTVMVVPEGLHGGRGGSNPGSRNRTMWRSDSASAISTMSLSSASSTISSSESESAASSSEGEEEDCEDIMMMAAMGNSMMAKKGEGAVPPPLQLLFAGEATHRSYYSTTHGAFLSGVREADRILHFYGHGPNRY